LTFEAGYEEVKGVDFEVGDKVVYPNHGIGVVEGIQARATECGEVKGYELRILANDSRVFGPHSSACDIGLRPMVRASEVRKILDLLSDGRIDQHNNWKGRFKENSDKMRTGSLFEVANVLKGLTFLSRQKSLSFREKRMLDRARFLIVSEIAAVEGKPSSVVEARVEQALSSSLRSRPRQRPVGSGRRSDA
jgi:CarD family transcriptional regulator